MTIANDADIHTLGLPAFTHGVYLTIIAIAQCTIGCCGKETYGILLVFGNLHLGLSIETTTIDIKGAIEFTQIIIALTIGSPYW